MNFPRKEFSRMKKRLAAAIVRYRRIVLPILLLLAVWSVFQIGRTRINYDLTRYLSDDTMTKKALHVMQEEFGSSEQLRLMFSGEEESSMPGIVLRLTEMPEILAAQYNPESDCVRKEGIDYRLVTLTLDNCDASALVPRLREMFPDAAVGGTAAAQLDIQRSVGAEIPGIMIIAVAVVFAVLLLTSHAWLEPPLLLVVFAVSILINMGTNFLFPDVSFITFAVCAILQLALSIDYAIMLLHTWNSYRDDGYSPEDAMVEALAACFMRIASSAFTTVAGLLSLLFMSFTIGFDIGLVLSKGILISMIGVFLLMPSLTLMLKVPLQKTRHRPLRFGGDRLGNFIFRHRKPVACLLTLLVLCGAFFSYQNEYFFMESGASARTDAGKIMDIFGASNPLVLLIPSGESDEDYDLQRSVVADLSVLKRSDGSPVVENITSMVTTGEAALQQYTVDDVAEMTGMNISVISLFFTMNGFGESVRADRLLAAAGSLAEGNEQIASLQAQLNAARKVFIGPNTQRLLLEPAFEVSDQDFNACMESILSVAERHCGSSFYITGGPMSTYDIGHAFRSDLLVVNLITLFAILLIVIFSFRSLLLPLLLVFVIEGAIWMTMGISRIAGEPIFFISYLICLSIQMGATIDYGILVCDQYRCSRRNGLPVRESVQATLHTALPTVLTSGTILATAGFIIGKQCSIYYISSIGLLLSRGAVLSAFLVLTLLPAFLVLMDRYIIRSRK